ncbi:MAG TPA: transcriptional repressor [Deltaproteobacteria bacterium]|nr:transcriptional repressor [Candidatus Binatota bacterium]HIL12475.1 transcriptional repressor [Deltaproteobacteria bacterium]
MKGQQATGFAAPQLNVAEVFLAAELSPTVQRRVLYCELRERSDHPDADALFDAVKQRLPDVSLATVYRNLRSFVNAGMATELKVEGSSSRWDGNTERHHHLLCSACGNVSDFFSEELDQLGNSLELDSGFEVQGLDVRVTGLCGDCRAP